MHAADCRTTRCCVGLFQRPGFLRIGLQAAPVLDLQGACPESHCLRHSSGTVSVDQALARLAGEHLPRLTISAPSSGGLNYNFDRKEIKR
jgi:hypothetical protein